MGCYPIAYGLESTLNYGLERVWAIGYLKSSHRVVIGYDGGKIMVKLGQEVPVASMDNNGKIFWSKHNEIQIVNINYFSFIHFSFNKRFSPLCLVGMLH
ncbi:hypothetical protein JHK87_006538 [Glycine soja]|nr:hypothetical protein JHK87_006538 [Glycine soja]